MKLKINKLKPYFILPLTRRVKKTIVGESIRIMILTSTSKSSFSSVKFMIW